MVIQPRRGGPTRTRGHDKEPGLLATPALAYEGAILPNRRDESLYLVSRPYFGCSPAGTLGPVTVVVVAVVAVVVALVPVIVPVPVPVAVVVVAAVREHRTHRHHRGRDERRKKQQNTSHHHVTPLSAFPGNPGWVAPTTTTSTSGISGERKASGAIFGKANKTQQKRRKGVCRGRAVPLYSNPNHLRHHERGSAAS